MPPAPQNAATGPPAGPTSGPPPAPPAGHTLPSAPPAGQSLPASSTSQELPSGQGPPSVKGPPSTPAGAQGPPSVPPSGHQGPPGQGSSFPPQVKTSEHLITKTNLALQVGGTTLAPNHTVRAAPVGHRPPPTSTSTSSSPAGSGSDQLRHDFDPRLPPAGVPPAGSSSSPYPAPSFAHSAPPHGSSPASSSGSVGAATAPGPAGAPPPHPAPAPAGGAPPSGAHPPPALPSAPTVSFLLSHLPNIILHIIPVARFQILKQVIPSFFQFHLLHLIFELL